MYEWENEETGQTEHDSKMCSPAETEKNQTYWTFGAQTLRQSLPMPLGVLVPAQFYI